MFKILISLAVALGLASVAYAAASEFQTTGQTVQISSAGTACQTSVAAISNINTELDGQTFNTFKVKNLDAACEGVRVIVRIYDDAAPGGPPVCSNSATQNATLVPAGGGEVTVTLNSPCNIATADIIRILLQSVSI